MTETLESTDTAVVAKSLGGYLDAIRNRPSECRTVRRTVDPNKYEVTGILEHLSRRGESPAVIFENALNLRGEPSGFGLVTNLWATRRRCAEMLGLEPEQVGAALGQRFVELSQHRFDPVIVGSNDAPVQGNVLEGEKADMEALPVVRHYEEDLGPVLTMAHVMRLPGEHVYNVTFAKTFVETPNRGGLTIHSADLSRMLGEWERRGERVPIVNILGHHPGFWLGSVASTPYGNNEYETIGPFLGEPLRLVPSVTWGDDFLVPADAEILIEGELIPGERTIVSPFGEISQLYQAQQLGPVMHVTAITYRENAILQDIFSGHSEHFLLGSIRSEGAILQHLQETVGNVTGVHLPNSGCGRFSAYIAVQRRFEGHAKQAALQTLSYHPRLQEVIVVDDEVDVFNEEDVLWAVNTYVDPDRDIDVIKNLRAGEPRGLGDRRLLIDATRPTHIPFPRRLRVPSDVLEAIDLDEWLNDV